MSKVRETVLKRWKQHGIKHEWDDFDATIAAIPEIDTVMGMLSGRIPQDSKVGDAALRKCLATVVGVCDAVMEVGPASGLVIEVSGALQQILARYPA